MLKGVEGDKGLVLKDKAAHHAISAQFPKKLDNKGKTLVVQYEVKLQGTSNPEQSRVDSSNTSQTSCNVVVHT